MLAGIARGEAYGAIKPLKRVLPSFKDGNGAVVIGTPEQPVATLNDTAARIWHLCDGNRCLDQIADEMAEEYHAHKRVILRDLRETILMLASNRLISF